MATVFTVAQFIAAQASGSLHQPITIQDTATNISHAFGVLFADPNVRAIVVSDNNALCLPPTDFFEALSPGLYGRALSITNLGGGAAHLTAMNAVTVGQLLTDEARHVTPPHVVADTAANVAAALPKLNGDPNVSAIWVQDGAQISLTGGQYQADLHALGEIVTSNTLNVSVTGAGQSFVSTGLNTDWTLSNTGDSFVFHAGFGQDVVAGYQPGRDSFSVDHSLFANFAAMFSHAASDGRGDVVITYNARETLTLTGVSLSQLQSHASDWRFT